MRYDSSGGIYIYCMDSGGGIYLLPSRVGMDIIELAGGGATVVHL